MGKNEKSNLMNPWQFGFGAWHENKYKQMIWRYGKVGCSKLEKGEITTISARMQSKD